MSESATLTLISWFVGSVVLASFVLSALSLP